jgi:Na+-driven multidrug efflux pump
MPQLFPSADDFRAGWHEMGVPARVGLPMGFQMSVIGLGTVILGAAINGLGTDAVAAATVAGRLEGLTMAPLNTFGVGMATFVAQNYEAKQYARVRVGVFRMIIVSVVVAFTLGTLQLLFADQLVTLFTDNPTQVVVAYVHTYFQISLFMYFTLGILFIVRNTIQSLGATAVPTIAGFVELGLRSLGALILAVPLGWVGVVWANPLAWAGAMLMCCISYISQRKRLLRLERGEIIDDVDAIMAIEETPEPSAKAQTSSGKSLISRLGLAS